MEGPGRAAAWSRPAVATLAADQWYLLLLLAEQGLEQHKAQLEAGYPRLHLDPETLADLLAGLTGQLVTQAEKPLG